MDAIVEESNKEGGEISVLPAGTALDRTKWATIREKLALKNADSLHSVESALIHVWLDDSAPTEDETNARQNLCRRGLHGDGTNIWFDKSYR